MIFSFTVLRWRRRVLWQNLYDVKCFTRGGYSANNNFYRSLYLYVYQSFIKILFSNVPWRKSFSWRCMQKLPHPLQQPKYWQTKIRYSFQIYIFFVYYVCFTFHIIFPSKFCPAILVFSYCFVFKSNCEHSTDCIFVKKKQFRKHGSCKAKGQFTCMESNPEPALGNKVRHWTKKSSPINVSTRKFSILTTLVSARIFQHCMDQGVLWNRFELTPKQH